VSVSVDASALSREAPGKRLYADAPAVANPAWLPEGSGWDALEELAVEHRRLIAQRSRLVFERAAVDHRFEQEDEEYCAELSAAMREQREPSADPRTPPEEREAAQRSAAENARAAVQAFDGFVRDAVARIEEEATGWLGDLATRQGHAAEKRREAERLVSAARGEEITAARLERWLKRNAGLDEQFGKAPALRHIPWADMQAYTPAPEPEPDGMGGFRPQLVDTWPGAEQHAANLNRGVIPPYRPTPEELARSEELRTNGMEVPLVPDARTITNEEE
jgi:hypothetical protein